jgi:hypothetical protein
MSPRAFPHRHNGNGTHDSICTECMTTVATVLREAELAGFEFRHVCDPVRVFQISQGWIAEPERREPA